MECNRCDARDSGPLGRHFAAGVGGLWLGGWMAKTVYSTATSIDGFIADHDNSLEWLFSAPGGHPDGNGDVESPLDEFGDFFAGVGAICMGSTTYEWVLEHDNVAEHPEKWEYEQSAWVFTSRDL